MRFATLKPGELDALTSYRLWRLRQQVFTVEQDCFFPDLDDLDLAPSTVHVLLLEDDADGAQVRGAARVLDLGDTWRIGRVVLDPTVRGRGFGEPLVEHALAACPGHDVLLDALAPLEGWYAAFGFEVCGPAYVEDEMPHVPMRLRRPDAS